jgi:putative DNA primase/helicase
MTKNSVPTWHTSLEVESSIASAIKEQMGVDFIPEAKEGIQRFPAPGKQESNQACWVWISDDLSRASFGSHITGEKYTWHADDFEKLSTEYIVEVHEKTAESKRESLVNQQQTQLEAAETAKEIINCAKPANPHHSYLSAKRVSPNDLHQDGATLIVTLYDSTGAICNVQKIYPDHSKYFLKGGRVKGAYAIIGEIFSTDTVLICEGWATGATLHEDTGYTVIAAMNAGNLLDVCIAIASKAPSSTDIIVAADNDHRTEGNPGVTKGKEAATAIGAKIIYPPLPCASKNCKCTDFNDWNNCSVRVMEASDA